MNTKKQKTAKRSLAVAAVFLVCIMAIGGTIAWLTSTSTLDNTFAVGMINPVDPNQPGPSPDKPINPGDKDNGKLDGNLFEPSWKQNSKLMPGATIAKDPYVGVGPGSEKSYVYIYVSNSMKNNDHIYFTINDGWEAVAGNTTVVSGSTEGQPGAKYTGGLFKYTAGLDGSQQTNNTWTAKALFDNVIVDQAANAEDFMSAPDTVGSITVKSFVHQMNNAEGIAINEQDVVIPAALEAVKK